LRSRRVAAVFSMGGYVAGPPVIAALIRRVPVVVMEPNAVPGFTNRRIARYVRRALISFSETARYFPRGRTELTGLPVREEFFAIPPKPRGETLHRADHRRQPGIAHAEPGRARKLAAVSRGVAAGAHRPSERPCRVRRVARGLRAIRPRGRSPAVHRGHAGRFRRGRPGGLPVRRGSGRRTRGRGQAVDSFARFRSRPTSTSCATRRRFVRAGAARLVEDRQMTAEKLFADRRGTGRRSRRPGPHGSRRTRPRPSRSRSPRRRRAGRGGACLVWGSPAAALEVGRTSRSAAGVHAGLFGRAGPGGPAQDWSPAPRRYDFH
jgi:hypothetical protein